ncbi:MAG TPA: class I SAM-dependent methyltransferase [Actinomycetota bacterium]|nr:class I SAM-dependent methyltransferase [Actinomycetota bacterium]
MSDTSEPQTWHYGVVARWWAEFNTSGPEIEYFRRFVEPGQPALDVACGTGRLLIPYLRDGLDVDGCDVSADMLTLCRERAEREGLSPTLRLQAMHHLDMPRRYRTIYVCGSFGVSGNREQSEQALLRMYEHLEPGGALVLDHEVPYAEGWGWEYWIKERRRGLPEPWPEPGERRVGSDGTEYELRSRIVEVDPLAQQITHEMRGFMWRDGRLVEQDEHVLKTMEYFPNELHLTIERAGFVDVEMRAAYTDELPNADTEFVVFIARKPSAGGT